MKKKNDIKTKLCVLYATGLGTGFSSFAPGTVGTLLAIPLVYLFDFISLPWFYAACTVTIFFTGVYASTVAEKYFKRKDPGHVNIDEIAGYLAFMFFLPFNWKTVILGFFIFRVMDIIKFPPTKFFEKFPGGWGIMLDDLIAAGYTLLIMIGVSIFF